MKLGDQPAFPIPPSEYRPGLGNPGMSTRTWLIGMMAQGRAVSEEGSFQSRAKWAVQMADALLAELEKEKPCHE